MLGLIFFFPQHLFCLAHIVFSHCPASICQRSVPLPARTVAIHSDRPSCVGLEEVPPLHTQDLEILVFYSKKPVCPEVSGGSSALLCCARVSCALQLLIGSCSEASVWQLTLYQVAPNQNPQRRPGKMIWRASDRLGCISYRATNTMEVGPCAATLGPAGITPECSLPQGPVTLWICQQNSPCSHSSCCLPCQHTGVEMHRWIC